MKKVISIALAAILMLLCVTGSLSASIPLSASFDIYLTSSQNMDFSDVKVNVYYQVNVVHHTEQLTTFDKELICSVTSNDKGKLSFPKPNAPFIVEFDMSTLPAGTGVKKQTLIYDVDSNSDIVVVYPVASVQPSLSSDELNFIFKDENGDNVLVNYEVVSHEVEELAQKVTLNSSTISCTLKHYGNVDVNGAVYSYHINKNYSDLDELEYANLLYNEGTITYDERIDMICNALQNEGGHKYLSCEMMYMLEEVQRETKNVALKQKISDALAVTTNSYIDNPDNLTYLSRTFYCSNGMNCKEGGVHNIRIYYCISTCKTANATLAADELLNIFDYYFNQLHFLCPPASDNLDFISDTDNSFCVILSTSVPLGSTVRNGIYSYMVMNPRQILMNNRYKTILAHELQHSIQYQYGLTKDTDKWWKESCANWAAMLYANNVLNDLSSRLDLEYKDGIKAYLNSAKKSLTCDDTSVRVYSSLLPMFLYQAHNRDGGNVIKSVYEQINILRSVDPNFNNRQIFTAIDSVVTRLGYSLRDDLEDFGRLNYNYADYYDWLKGTNWTDVTIPQDPLFISNLRLASIDEAGYEYYKLSSSPGTVSIQITANCTDPTQITCWVIEGFGDTKVSKATKLRFSSEVLFAQYTFTSALGENLVLIVENTSTSEGALMEVTVY